VLGKWMEANPEKVIEVLVNNAGIREDALMIWMKDEQWDSVINTSLGGFFLCNKVGREQHADEKIWKDHQYCFAFRFKRNGPGRPIIQQQKQE
jgi:NAD(P)-dependent dehydrogenase (short-subunit alcohol dehydrogenase family)